jgi:hypothetical protein
MSRASSSCVALCFAFALGCKGGERKPAPAAKADAASQAKAPRKTKIEVTREQLLMLDAALEKLRGEMEVTKKAGDFEALAAMRDKETALLNALEKTREELRVLEFMKERKEGPEPAPP